MDGIGYLHNLHEALGESSTSTWPKALLSYEYLYRSAVETANRSGVLTTIQTITTVQGQANYKLNADFLRLYLTDNQNRVFVRYYDGTNYNWLYFTDYDAIVQNNATSNVLIPEWFSIRDMAQPANITGAVSAGLALTSTYTIFGESLGEALLTTTGGILSSVSRGDVVHNTTDVSRGYVIDYTDTNNVTCALFEGTDNYFETSDAFIVIPQARYELYIDPPPSTAGHTILVHYVRRPNPVFSAYRAYPFASGFTTLVEYAAWKYKYRDREPDFGDYFYKQWDMEVRSLAKAGNRAKNKRGFRVNFSKSSGTTHTLGRY